MHSTDDVESAARAYDLLRAQADASGERVAVGIFDDVRGEGEPLDPDGARERAAVPLCQDHPVAGQRRDRTHVPFHRTPGIGNVKCLFLNALLVREGPAWDLLVANDEGRPMAERAAACARLADAEDGPPLVCLAWNGPTGDGRDHGTLLHAGPDWLLERADCDRFTVRPEWLTELEVVDA